MNKKRTRTIRFSFNSELLAVGGITWADREKSSSNKNGHMYFMRVPNILRRMANYGVYHKDTGGSSAF